MANRACLGVILVLTVAACGQTAEPIATTSTDVTSTDVSSAPPTSSTTLPLVGGCGEGGDFFEGGVIGELNQEESDSTGIGTISWSGDEACEAFTIDFVTSEGAPPTTPPSVSATYVGELPIVRIQVDVEGTVITDQLVESAFVDRLYVVRALDGGMFIDMHLSAPAQTRIRTSNSPAELEIEYQPGIVDYALKVESTDLVVLTSPADGAPAEAPIGIEGYSRTFEANVLILVTTGDQLIEETFTTAADYVDTWGEFRTEVTLDPGDYSLFVGDESAQDGSLQGVTIDLTVR